MCAKQGDFDKSVAEGDSKEAVRLLRAYDELAVSKEQAWKLLDSIPLDVSEENETEQQILVSLTYASLRKRGILSGFGAVPVTPEALPLSSKEIDVQGLEAAIALPMSALTPKGSSAPWSAIGCVCACVRACVLVCVCARVRVMCVCGSLGFCGIEYGLAQQLGYDPMRTVVPVGSTH